MQKTVMCLRGIEISFLLQKRHENISWNVVFDVQLTVRSDKFL